MLRTPSYVCVRIVVMCRLSETAQNPEHRLSPAKLSGKPMLGGLLVVAVVDGTCSNPGGLGA